MLILFSKVASPPPTQPQTAFWHFGWQVTDVRRNVETYKTRPEVKQLPLYTTEEGGSVLVSSDTWPGTGGVLGLNKAQIADAKAKGVEPARKGGFAYMRGPDNVIIEYLGDYPAERFNHVHMFQEEPFCAQLWYRQHLNAAVVPGRAGGAELTRGQLQGRARARSDLAGAGTGRALPHPHCRGDLRRRGADLVRPPGQPAARAAARP